MYTHYRKFIEALQVLKQSDAEMVPAGFVPISEYSRRDIFIVGYPKSGNTWFQHLVAGVVFGVDPGLGPFALAQELVPDADAVKYYRRYASEMFFKSHALPRPEFRRVVYLLRDGRDVMVSYKHYREVVDKVKYAFPEFVSPHADVFPCHWPTHVDAWAQNPYRAQVLWIKYEDLLSRPVRELERFCAFVGITRDTAHLRAVAEAASFAKFRAKEAKEGFTDPRFSPPKFFFRRGVTGSYKDEMPPEALEIFLGRAAGTLRRHGYEVGQFDAARERAATISGAEALV